MRHSNAIMSASKYSKNTVLSHFLILSKTHRLWDWKKRQVSQFDESCEDIGFVCVRIGLVINDELKRLTN